MRQHRFWRLCVMVLLLVGTLSVGGPRVHADSLSPRSYPQTGYSIDNDTIWNYFSHRGGVATFGYPTSRAFTFQGYTTQFFQRRIIQLDENGNARLLNILDRGLMPYTQFNGATFPGIDNDLLAFAPSPTDAPAVLAFVKGHTPDTFSGLPVDFYQTFANAVPLAVAFPSGGNADLLPGFNLEMWGMPTSQPTFDLNNHNFVYQRFQRGIMMFDASCNCTQGVLLGDYLKSILTGQNLPTDLAQEAASSPFFSQYDPGAPNAVRDPYTLPNTDLTNAFTPSTAGPTCDFQTSSTLSQVFQGNPQVASKLGCAENVAISAQFAWQSFQGGQMLWRSGTQTIFGLLGAGTWSGYTDTYVNGEPLPIFLPPPGFFAPVRGFGKAWEQAPNLRQELGWATQVEHGMSGWVQDFAGGKTLWTYFDNYTGNPSRKIYVLYSGGTWWEQSYSGAGP